MADLSVKPVGADIKPVQGMSLADMINLAGGIQSLRQAQQINPLQVERAQAELSRLQQLTPEELKRAQAEAIVAEETKTPRISSAKSQAKTAESESQKSELGLAEKQMEFFEKKSKKIADSQISMINNPLIIRAEKGDPSIDQIELIQLVKQNGLRMAKELGIPDDEAEKLMAPYIEVAQNSPMELRQFFKQRHLEGLDQASRTSVISGTGTPITTGGGGYSVQASEFGPERRGEKIPGTTYRQELLPGQREMPTGRLDLNNQPTFYRYGPDGRYLGEFTVSGTPVEAPGAQAPTAEPVARVRPGESDITLKAANEIRMAASNAAKQVPNQIENNNKIIALADKVTTGKGAVLLSNLTGGYAPYNALGIGGNNTTGLNELGHYMAQQTASLSASSGLGGTDAARGLAGEISGTTEWTPDAIKSTARVNRALSTATELFNRGVKKAFEKTKDPFSARDFQDKWAQTVNIKAIRLYDAMKNKDNQAIREIVNEVGGQDSLGYQDLINNIGKTQKLLGGQ